MISSNRIDHDYWLRGDVECCKLKVNQTAIATNLLHACARSREIAQKRYKSAFKFLLRKPIYFGSGADTIYLPDCNAALEFTPIWGWMYGE
jgi:hypothetical protein